MIGDDLGVTCFSVEKAASGEIDRQTVDFRPARLARVHRRMPQEFRP